MKKTKYIVGNWKMNKDAAEVKEFFTALDNMKLSLNCEAWVAPQFIHIPLALEYASKSGVKVGAQNCSNKVNGAFTGEVSPKSLKDIGASFVILGHSERRQYFTESHQFLNEKVLLTLENGLTPIFCIGETLEERKSSKTFNVIKEQTIEALKNLTQEQLKKLVIAYEPVWAIGTGMTATSAQAEEVQAYIRELLKNDLKMGQDAEIVPILYGGSVKPDNVAELLSQKNIDGALVGGASLKADDYSKLCLAASEKKC